MSRWAKAIFFVFIVMVSVPWETYAQSRSAGLTFSYSCQGLTYEYDIDSYNFADFQIGTETMQLFDGKAAKPGIMTSAGWNVIFAQKESGSGSTISFFAGPGISLGYAGDRNAGNGLVLGLRGRIGGECIFDRLALSISVSPLIAGHFTMEDGMLNMRGYRNGVLGTLTPQVGIKYSFHAPETRTQVRDPKRKKLSFGLEWGYVSSLYRGHRHDFFVPEGFRVDDRGRGFMYYSNAEAYANVGYRLNDRWKISLYAGYEGICDMHKAVPVSIRATRYFGDDPSVDRWFTYLDLGSGISIKNPVQEIYTGKIGGGYRIALSSLSSLDFIFALRTVITHPDITYEGTPIGLDMINMNLCQMTSASFGIAISFN